MILSTFRVGPGGKESRPCYPILAGALPPPLHHLSAKWVEPSGGPQGDPRPVEAVSLEPPGLLVWARFARMGQWVETGQTTTRVQVTSLGSPGHWTHRHGVPGPGRESHPWPCPHEVGPPLGLLSPSFLEMFVAGGDRVWAKPWGPRTLMRVR